MPISKLLYIYCILLPLLNSTNCTHSCPYHLHKPLTKNQNILLHESFNGNLTKVKEMIALKVDINIQDHKGRTPLMLAAHGSHLHIVKHLVSNGANCNAKSDLGLTPLFSAVGSGNFL